MTLPLRPPTCALCCAKVLGRPRRGLCEPCYRAVLYLSTQHDRPKLLEVTRGIELDLARARMACRWTRIVGRQGLTHKP